MVCGPQFEKSAVGLENLEKFFYLEAYVFSDFGL